MLEHIRQILDWLCIEKDRDFSIKLFVRQIHK